MSPPATRHEDTPRATAGADCGRLLSDQLSRLAYGAVEEAEYAVFDATLARMEADELAQA